MHAEYASAHGVPTVHLAALSDLLRATARTTSLAIRTGGDNDSEIGVLNALFQPQREANLRLRLDEYLRFGLHAGLFFAS